MTVNHIIEQLYNSKEVDDCIRKMVRQDHRQDFKQELFLKIYEIPAQRLLMLDERKELKFYVVRCLINLVKNNSSVYNKNYVKPERDNVTMWSDHKTRKEDNDDYSAAFKNEAMLLDLKNPDELAERIESEERECRAINEINNNFDDAFNTPYYRTLVHLISEHGSMREVSRQTGIPIASISEAVKKARNHLKNKIYNGEPVKGIY